MTDPHTDPSSATVGERLRAAREAEGLTLAEIAARTRVPQRHLEAIETGQFGNLPSPTYAVGFVRAYARTVGADEVALARDARAEVAATSRPAPRHQPYEIADPARTPSRTLVIVATGLGLAVLVLGLLWFTTGMFGRPSTGVGGEAFTPPVAVASSAAAPVTQPVPPASGQVTLTATDEVWLRVYDAADATLYLGTMQPGERFEVPATANDPKINVGRPDKLQVTLNGSAVPPLGDGSRPIKDVAVSAAALAARLSGAPAPAPTAAPTPATETAPPAFAPVTRATTAPRAAPRPAPTTRPLARPSTRPSARPSGPENLLPSAFGPGA